MLRQFSRLFSKSRKNKTSKRIQAPRLGVEALETRVVPSSVPLHVQGNQLVDQAGHAVALRGVNIISLEWRPDGDNMAQAVDLAIHDWHANLLRLPVNEDFWFGHNQAWGQGEAGDGGAAYRSVVDQIISTANANNVYVMLDLHWSDMGVWGSDNGQHFAPDDHSTLFWQDAGARYANNPAVMFDPYNEPTCTNDIQVGGPTDADFAKWRDGGQIERTDDAANLIGGTFHSPGLQGLINTIRGAGANNVIAPEGLNWGSNLNGVLTGHALTDPLGNLMYQSHLYPDKLADNGIASAVENVAKNFPIYVGEWGDGGLKGQPSNGAAQSNQDMIAYLNNHPSFSWTAWAFTPDLNPDQNGNGGYYNLLTSWDANATTSDYGAYVKAALAAAAPIPPAPPAAGHHTGFSTSWTSSINGTGPQLLASGNFNSQIDSIPDVAVTSSDGYLTIMRGRGNGFFDATNRYFVGSPEGVVAGDFNHDGNQDLAVASNNGFVAVFLGDGTGVFNRIADLPPGPNAGEVPTYLATADMDGDGNLDLVVADFSHPNVMVYTGQGDGTFQLHDYNFAANGVSNAEQVVLADFNGDGILDVAVANKGNGSVSLFKGLGGGYITAAGNVNLPGVTGSIGLAAGDLDGDGKVDLAVSNYGTDAAVGARRLDILLNTSANGDISFGDPVALDFGNHLLNVAIADFNEDGRNDIAVSSSGSTVDPNAPKDNEVFVLYNQGHAPGEVNFFVPAMGLTHNWNPVGLISVDVNQDGHIDLASCDQDSNCVSVDLNKFEAAAATQQTASLSVPASVEWGVTASATFAMKAPAGGANVTGTVTLTVDGVQQNVVTVNSPDFSYRLMLDTGAPATHTISVTYSGDANYQPITITKDMTVTKRATQTTLSAPASVATGKYATLTATVSSIAPGITGYVAFMDGAKLLGTSRVVNGTATFKTYSLAIGSHTITAHYKGDAKFELSESSNSQTVKVTGNITSRFRITKSAVTIDPATGLATQTITLKNTTAHSLSLPATLLFQNLAAGYTRIGVVGQTGASGNSPLMAIASDNDNLLPGETLTILVSFMTAKTNIRYSLSVLFQ